MPKTNHSLKNGIEIVKIKTELTHIKKELTSIKDEQKKLSAYANMGKGGLRVVIWVGYIIAVTIGYFVGDKL
mgnify:FL=1